MSLLVLAVLLIGAYAVIYTLARRYKRTHNVDWLDIPLRGFIAIRTSKTRIFDSFSRFRFAWRSYGYVSIGVVFLFAFLMFMSLISVVMMIIDMKPQPEGVFNIGSAFVLPGINPLIPSTFAVWFALILTVFVHEFGHGLMSRVENVAVRYTGIIIAVIPIGFFVDPDENELKAASRSARTRIYSAGIMNNFVVGLICLGLVVGFMGMASPVTTPIVYGVLKDGPADLAGIKPDMVITAVDGEFVATQNEMVARLQSVQDPNNVQIMTETNENGVIVTKQFTDIKLLEGNKLGITSYPAAGFLNNLGFNAYTFTGMITAPLSAFGSNTGFGTRTPIEFSVLPFDSVATKYYLSPFPFFWDLIHLLFWCGWFNLNIGIFNALPMLPLDGGLVVKEYLEPAVRRIPFIGRYADRTMTLLSAIIFMLLAEMLTLPYVFKFFS